MKRVIVINWGLIIRMIIKVLSVVALAGNALVFLVQGASIERMANLAAALVLLLMVSEDK